MKPSVFRWFVVRLFAVVLGVHLFFTAGRLPAQEQPQENAFKGWNSYDGLQIRAAMHCIAGGNPLGALGARMLASEYVPLRPEWQFKFDEVIPLKPHILELIQDRRKLPDLRAKIFRELPLPDQAFYAAYVEALWRSDVATPEMFKNSAEKYKHVVYPDLLTDANRYRGKIITVQGKLSVIRRREPPHWIDKDIDLIQWVYTSFIVPPAKGVPPYTIAFTQLPDGVEFGENLDMEVRFQGYFLARVVFPPEKEAGGTQKAVISPYLVGKTFSVLKKHTAQKTEGAYASPLVLAGFVVVVLVVLTGGILNFWFRRGDRKIHSHLADVRDRHRPFELEPDTATDPLPAPPPEEEAVRVPPSPANSENGIQKDAANGAPPTG